MLWQFHISVNTSHVSGFNTEYRSGGFTLIFIAEYARIIFIRFLFFISLSVYFYFILKGLFLVFAQQLTWKSIIFIKFYLFYFFTFKCDFIFKGLFF